MWARADSLVRSGILAHHAGAAVARGDSCRIATDDIMTVMSDICHSITDGLGRVGAWGIRGTRTATFILLFHVGISPAFLNG